LHANTFSVRTRRQLLPSGLKTNEEAYPIFIGRVVVVPWRGPSSAPAHAIAVAFRIRHRPPCN
jgi:hypothetical protein